MLIILDNNSTVDVLFNTNIMQNTNKANNDLAILSTGGKTKTNMVGYLPRYVTVWFHPCEISNILYPSKVPEKYRVCHNITNGNNFLVHLPIREMRFFQQCPRGLLYSDMTYSQEKVLINTVEDNRSRYSERDYYRALEERNLQYKISLTSHRQLLKVVENKNQSVIQDSPPIFCLRHLY